MACRVGITIDPDRRKAKWQKDLPTFKSDSWEIITTCGSKKAAQDQETLEAKRLSCTAHPGGDGPEYATWYVYYFEY